MFGLYIHIPFCSSICSYCDFSKKIKRDDAQVRQYLDVLFKELDSYKSYFSKIDSIYIGGGTPNSISNEYLLELFERLSDIKALEFSIECNIEHITEEQLILFKKYNVNRLSIGIQTIDPKGIKILNRHHNKQLVLDKFMLINKYFTNVSCDFIYGYPYESIRTLKKDLKFIKKLNLKHVSFYNLIIEENTLFNRIYKDYNRDDKLELKMAKIIKDKLLKMNFYQYEFSNYAKCGYESFHNLKYWNKEEYIGVGLGATSYLDHTRITNPKKFHHYMNNYSKDIEYLDIDEEKKEFLILGLRKIKGVSIDSYYNRFNTNLFSDFNLTESFKYNLLRIDNNYLSLTDKGINLSNFVFREILSCFMS